MVSELRRFVLVVIIDLIENSWKFQECIDEIYEKLCDIIFNEMEVLILKVEYKNKNKCLKNSKFYWID